MGTGTELDPDRGSCADGAIEQLVRWEASGGHWRVVSRTPTELVVGLYTCDGGTEMGRVVAPPAELDGFLAGREASDDPGE